MFSKFNKQQIAQSDESFVLVRVKKKFCVWQSKITKESALLLNYNYK